MSFNITFPIMKLLEGPPMNKTKPKIKISKKWMESFCKNHHIIKLALFGSVLTDRFSTTSDVDILVEFDPSPGMLEFVALKFYLEHKFQCYKL